MLSLTIEQKKEALRNALSEVLSSVFGVIEWEKSTDSPHSFILDRKESERAVRTMYLAGCRDAWGGTISVKYNPADDIVGFYIKDRPIQAKFKDDLLSLFDKYSPFAMKLSFDEKMTPILSREEKVEPKDFQNFLNEFRKAYDEYYPLFYMITVCATEWYDGFAVRNTYCVDGVYY